MHCEHEDELLNVLETLNSKEIETIKKLPKYQDIEY